MLCRSSIDALFSSADLEKDLLIYFEASQHIAVNHARVESDFVRQIVEHGHLRRMPEQDRIGQFVRAIDEGVPDPE